MKRVIFIILTAFLTLSSSSFAEMQETKLNVTGMFCDGCVSRVQDTLESTSGVTSAVVKYDSGKTNPENLAQVVTDSGFESTVSR